MIYGITYSSGNMDRSAELCRRSMLVHGCYGAKQYVPDDIPKEFVKYNYEIFNSTRGGGYWLWKPYIINHSLFNMAEGGYLIYSDAGVEFTGSIRPIIDAMDQDIFLFSNGHPHYDWCKRIVYDTILPERWWQEMAGNREEMPQVQASVIIIKNTQFSRDLVKSWLLYSQMPGFIDDTPSPQGERPGFQDGRHDQAILTCLAYKYGIKQHWWPTQYSQHLQRNGDNYPAIFNHHRRRNKGCGLGDTEWPD